MGGASGEVLDQVAGQRLVRGHIAKFEQLQIIYIYIYIYIYMDTYL